MPTVWPIFFAFLFISTMYKGWLAQADEQEYRLIRYLMSNYDPAVRPSMNATLPLKVAFELSLRQIVDVDEENQVLSTNCWLTERWNDVHLRWNASDFGGISVVRLPAHQVWRPDIVLYNNVDLYFTASTVSANVILHSTGDVLWLSRGVFRSSCEMNIEFFPFDIQTCFLKFASWTHDMLKIELSSLKGKGSLAEFQANGEFDLDDFSSDIVTEEFSCCDEKYHVLVYTVSLRRRPLFFVFYLILPCFMINIVSVFSFYVPCRSGEKVTLSVGSLVSIMFLLTIVRDSLPHSPSIPLISIYYCATLCLVGFAAIFSVLTLGVHYKGMRGTQVPHCVKRCILGCLANMLFISFTSQQKEPKLKKSSSVDVVRESKAVGLDRIEHYTVSPRLRHRSETPASLAASGTASRSTGDEQFERRFLRILHEVHETMERNERRIAEQEQKEEMINEWEKVATVCDRFLLIIFLLITFLSVFLVLFTSVTMAK